MFVSCVNPVAVLNAAFCMTCSLLMQVKDSRGDHMGEAYSRAGLMTALLIAMSVSFCLPHPVALSAFIICMLMCMYRNGCAPMGSALLFMLRSRLLVYSIGSGVNRVQVLLSGFSLRLFSFVQTKTVCRYGCMYLLVAFVLVYVAVMVMCVVPLP